MVPWGTRALIPVISKHFRNTQFCNLGAMYLHQRRAKYVGLLTATNEVVRRHDMQAWPHTVHVTLPQALGHPRGVKVAAFFFFFMRNPRHTQASFKPWNLGKGHLSGVASYRAPPCAGEPKTSESRNDQMKSAERTSNVKGTRAMGRLQTTQEKERQFSAVGRLTPSRRAL